MAVINTTAEDRQQLGTVTEKVLLSPKDYYYFEYPDSDTRLLKADMLVVNGNGDLCVVKYQGSESYQYGYYDTAGEWVPGQWSRYNWELSQGETLPLDTVNLSTIASNNAGSENHQLYYNLETKYGYSHVWYNVYHGWNAGASNGFAYLAGSWETKLILINDKAKLNEVERTHHIDINQDSLFGLILDNADQSFGKGIYTSKEGGIFYSNLGRSYASGELLEGATLLTRNPELVSDLKSMLIKLSADNLLDSRSFNFADSQGNRTLFIFGNSTSQEGKQRLYVITLPAQGSSPLDISKEPWFTENPDHIAAIEYKIGQDLDGNKRIGIDQSTWRAEGPIELGIKTSSTSGLWLSNSATSPDDQFASPRWIPEENGVAGAVRELLQKYKDQGIRLGTDNFTADSTSGYILLPDSKESGSIKTFDSLLFSYAPQLRDDFDIAYYDLGYANHSRDWLLANEIDYQKDFNIDGLIGSEKIATSLDFAVNANAQKFVNWSHLSREKAKFGYLSIGNSILLVELQTKTIAFAESIDNLGIIRLRDKEGGLLLEVSAQTFVELLDLEGLNFGNYITKLSPVIAGIAANTSDPNTKAYLSGVADSLANGVQTLTEYDQILPILKQAIAGGFDLAAILPASLTDQAPSLGALILSLPTSTGLERIDQITTNVSIIEGSVSEELLLVHTQGSAATNLSTKKIDWDFNRIGEITAYVANSDDSGYQIKASVENTQLLQYGVANSQQKIGYLSPEASSLDITDGKIYYYDQYEGGYGYIVKSKDLIDWSYLDRDNARFGYLDIGGGSIYIFDLSSGYSQFIKDTSKPTCILLEGTHPYDHEPDLLDLKDFILKLDQAGFNYSTYLSGLKGFFPSLNDGINGFAEYDAILPVLKSALANKQFNLSSLLPEAKSLNISEEVRSSIAYSLTALILNMPLSKSIHTPVNTAFIDLEHTTLSGGDFHLHTDSFFKTQYLPITKLEWITNQDLNKDGYVAYDKEITSLIPNSYNLGNGPSAQYVNIVDTPSEYVVDKAPLDVNLYLEPSSAWSRESGKYAAKNLGSKTSHGTGEIQSLIGLGRYEGVFSAIPEVTTSVWLSNLQDSAFFLDDAFSKIYNNVQKQRILNIDSIYMRNAGGKSIVDLTSKDYVTGGVTVYGADKGRSIFWGSEGNDTFVSLDGDSVIFGGAGSNAATLGAGRDILQYRAGVGAVDRVEGFDRTKDAVELWIGKEMVTIEPQFTSVNGSTTMKWGGNTIEFVGIPDLTLSNLQIFNRVA